MEAFPQVHTTITPPLPEHLQRQAAPRLPWRPVLESSYRDLSQEVETCCDFYPDLGLARNMYPEKSNPFFHQIGMAVLRLSPTLA